MNALLKQISDAACADLEKLMEEGSAEAERDQLKKVLDGFAIPHVIERKTK